MIEHWETERLILEPTKEEDLNQLAKLLMSYNVSKYIYEASPDSFRRIFSRTIDRPHDGIFTNFSNQNKELWNMHWSNRVSKYF